jgi:hypothetical protein
VLFSSNFPVARSAPGSAPLTQEQQRSPADRALLEAVQTGQTDVIKNLLAAGVNPNARNFSGVTALMFAAHGGHLEMAKALLAAGADPNAQNNDGMDALMAATSRGHCTVAEILKNAGAQPASERFVLEMQKTADRFEQRLQQTRDFAPLLEEFFARRFLDCHVQTMLLGKENGIFNQIGSVSLPAEVAKQVSHDELGRYLITVLNFFHLKTLHRVSKHEWGRRDVQAIENEEQDYPPGVYDLLQKNWAAGKTSKSVDELRAKVLTLEQAGAMMRERFLKHAPELNDPYRKNLERIGNTEYNSKFREIELWKLPENEARGISKCLGQRVTRLAAIKVPPFYRLFFVEAAQTFKIGTMLCTEPPCSD